MLPNWLTQKFDGLQTWPLLPAGRKKGAHRMGQLMGICEVARAGKSVQNEGRGV